MSQELGKINDLQVTAFWGGIKRGACIQLSPDEKYDGGFRDSYSHLTIRETEELIKLLQLWLSGFEEGK